MDDLDQRILTELEQNGFRKAESIARALRVGERTIRRRIKDMTASNSIKVIAVPNPVVCGFTAWTKIGIKVAPGYISSVARALVSHPSVYFVAYALGRFDIIIAVHFGTVQRLAHFVNAELVNIKGILNTEPWMLVFPRKYYHFSWPAPVFEKIRNRGKHYYEVAFNQTSYEMDELDQRILDILKVDGLARPASLKSKLGIGESTIRKHIKNMLNHGVYRLEAVPNPEILQYEAWATIGISVNQRHVDEVMDSVLKHSQVYLASVSLGRFNMVIAARFHNTDFLNHFVTQDLQSIPGIASTETFLHNRPIKYHNVSWPRLIDGL